MNVIPDMPVFKKFAQVKNHLAEQAMCLSMNGQESFL